MYCIYCYYGYYYTITATTATTFFSICTTNRTNVRYFCEKISVIIVQIMPSKIQFQFLASWLCILCCFGPFFFATYCSSITALCHLYDVQQQQYADDTQLYIALSPSDPRNELNALHTCLTSLQTCFCTNGMALNLEKFSAVWLGMAHRASSYSSLTSVNVAGTCSVGEWHIKLLGVTLDTNLTVW